MDVNGPETFSRLMLHSRRQISRTERSTMQAQKEPRVRRTAPRPVLRPEFAARLEALAPIAMTNVAIRLTEAPEDRVDIGLQLDKRVASGEISSDAEYESARSALQSERAARVAAAIAGFEAQLTNVGGRVTARCLNSYCLSAEAPAGRIAEIAQWSGLKKLDPESDGRNNAVSIHGQHVSQGQQMEQFLPEDGEDTSAGEPEHSGGNWGATAGTTRIRVALLEGYPPNEEHLGFKDDSGSTSRIIARYDCDTGSCEYKVSYSDLEEHWHATQVGGLLFGDVRDEQDNSFGSGYDPEQQRSGYAGEAQAILYDASLSGTSIVRTALDHITSFGANYPTLVNMSIGWTTDDTSCDGDTALSEDANDVFEDDKFLVFAAGGSPGSVSNCTVDSPGSAIGVFTVGATGNDGDTGSVSTVRGADIHDDSPWGGNTTEGSNRTIVDVVSYGCRKYQFDTSGGYGQAACGTSYAAPTVAAGMVSFADWYINQGWADVRTEPGRLFSNALLFGDKYNGSSYLDRKYHSRWGAGRFKMRRYNDAGMDYPWEYRNGWTCVDDNEVVTIDVNDGVSIPSDAEDFKAVVWWYDRRHENGTSIDDIDLYLKTTGGTQIESSVDSFDNKERVYEGAIGSWGAVELQIVGYDVTADDEGCGTNSMKVWWAYFLEDDDRDDGDGPSVSEIEREL